MRFVVAVHVPAVVGVGDSRVVADKRLAAQNRFCAALSQRNEKPRLYKRPPDSLHDLRHHGQKENYHDNRYGTFATSDV